MKRTILFGTLCAATAMIAVSCKKSDSGGSNNGLTGKWALQKERVVSIITYFTPPQYDTSNVAYAPGQYSYFYEFDANGGLTATSVDSPQVVKGSYMVFSSSKLGLKQQGASAYDTVNYSLSANNLVISSVDTSTPYVQSDYTLTFVRQ